MEPSQLIGIHKRQKSIFKPFRTTISLPLEVWDHARRQSDRFHNGNLSAYLRALIQKDAK